MAHKLHDFQVFIEKDEDGVLIASVPALHGCHTHAKTLPVLMKRIKEAIELCLEVQKGPFHLNKFVGLQEVEVALSK